MITPEREAFLNSKYQELYDFFEPLVKNIKNEGYKSYENEGKYYKPIDEIILKKTIDKVSYYPQDKYRIATNMIIDKPTFFYLPYDENYLEIYTGYADLEGGFYIQLSKLTNNPLPPFDKNDVGWFSTLQKTNPEMFKLYKPPENASVYRWNPVLDTLDITSLLPQKRNSEFLNWKTSPWEMKS